MSCLLRRLQVGVFSKHKKITIVNIFLFNQIAVEKHFQLLSRGTGSLTKAEALKALQSIGQDPSRKEFNDALVQANLNKPDEKISLDEFKLLAQLIWNENPLESILIDAFRQFDKSNSGMNLFKKN